jgi:hypothetical protein
MSAASSIIPNYNRVGQQRLAAVVTPVYRLPFTDDEKISIRHLRERLGHFDRFMVGPEDLLRSSTVAGEYSDFRPLAFAARHFESIVGYDQLLLSESFYRAFADYEYILIHQLDCLVFSSNLEEWCQRGWDYVGAPWFRGYRDDPAGGLWAVGNGGLSLRRVASALRVLTSNRVLENSKIVGVMAQQLGSLPPRRKRVLAMGSALFEHGDRGTARWLVRQFGRFGVNEDLFWAFGAWRLAPSFRVPTPQEALGFSFETAPRYCFEANSARLPFGCHAWTKYDRKFWERFLLK